MIVKFKSLKIGTYFTHPSLEGTQEKVSEKSYCAVNGGYTTSNLIRPDVILSETLVEVIDK